jgi:hypothetical protein
MMVSLLSAGHENWRRKGENNTLVRKGEKDG